MYIYERKKVVIGQGVFYFAFLLKNEVFEALVSGKYKRLIFDLKRGFWGSKSSKILILTPESNSASKTM